MSEQEPGPDRGGLVWGTLFTVVGLTYLLQAAGVWEVRGEVLLPVLLIAVGVVVVVSGLGGGSGRQEPS